LKDWIPYYGDKSVRKKIRELKNSGMAIPVLFSVGFTKVIEKLINSNVSMMLRWSVYTLSIGFFYIYWSELDQIKEDVKEKAEDISGD